MKGALANITLESLGNLLRWIARIVEIHKMISVWMDRLIESKRVRLLVPVFLSGTLE